LLASSQNKGPDALAQPLGRTRLATGNRFDIALLKLLPAAQQTAVEKMKLAP
jgi:hypothetical protein